MTSAWSEIGHPSLVVAGEAQLCCQVRRRARSAVGCGPTDSRAAWVMATRSASTAPITLGSPPRVGQRGPHQHGYIPRSLSGPACFEQGRPELRVSLVALRLTEAAQRRDSRRSLEGGGIVEQSEDLLEAGLGVAQRAGPAAPVRQRPGRSAPLGTSHRRRGRLGRSGRPGPPHRRVGASQSPRPPTGGDAADGSLTAPPAAWPGPTRGQSGSGPPRSPGQGLPTPPHPRH
jgi:hypothetical protein